MVEIAQRQRWVKLRGHLTKSQSHLFSRDLEERFEAKIKMVVLVFLFSFSFFLFAALDVLGLYVF